ncbi:MAG: hypothetical protein U0T83_04335 [Bacteriovoracaceae bacterium]
MNFNWLLLTLTIQIIIFGCTPEKKTSSEKLHYSDTRTQAVTIKGFSLSATPITSSDNLLTAFGKAQGQINNKEKTITAGATTQYYRGDKTWQTLDSSVVVQGSKYYFTTANVLAVPMTGISTTNATPIAATDSIIQAVGKAQAELNNKLSSGTFIDWSISGLQTIDPSRLSIGVSSASKSTMVNSTGLIIASTASATEIGYLTGVSSNIQTQLNAKQATISNTTTLSVAKARVYGTANTSYYIELDVPTLAASLSFILPSSDGTNNQVLKTDGGGNLSFDSMSNLEPVTSVNTLTGTVVLTTTDVAEGTNLYYTTARVGTAARATIMAGFLATPSPAITSADSIVGALGKLQAQINSLGSTKINLTGGTLTSGTISGVPTPSSSTQVASKAYVDSFIKTCPTNYILVPKNSSYFNRDFCVMKYEAKDDGYGAATSTSSGTPWVNIDRPTARAACQNLGSNYDLISNEQWQTIAQNIAGVATNWSNGIVLDDRLNVGHADANPNNTLAASSDDVNDNCYGTNQTCDSSTWDSQRRTHVLSNGNIIWDFGGNVWEWQTNDNNVVNGADDFMANFSGGDIRQTRYGATAFCATPGSSPYCGMGFGNFNYNAGTVIRGSAYNIGGQAGIFSVHLGLATTYTGTSTGFRCVYVP